LRAAANFTPYLTSSNQRLEPKLKAATTKACPLRGQPMVALFLL